jgi:hypothetical protein
LGWAETWICGCTSTWICGCMLIEPGLRGRGPPGSGWSCCDWVCGPPGLSWVCVPGAWVCWVLVMGGLARDRLRERSLGGGDRTDRERLLGGDRGGQQQADDDEGRNESSERKKTVPLHGEGPTFGDPKRGGMCGGHCDPAHTGNHCGRTFAGRPDKKS